MNYLERIKKIKAEKHLTTEQLSEKCGVSRSTLAKMLSGVSDSPKLSVVAAVADALGCSLDYVVTGRETEPLTEDEKTLLASFRSCDEAGKDIVLTLSAKEAERAAAAGTADYSEPDGERPGYVEASGAFLKRSIRLYPMPTAETGGTFDGSDSRMISIPDTPENAAADFAVRLPGSGMAPRYRAGDILLIERRASVELGEIGLFLLDGDGIVRRFDEDRLVPLNREMGDILLRGFSSVACVGRVIGKLKRR